MKLEEMRTYTAIVISLILLFSGSIWANKPEISDTRHTVVLRNDDGDLVSLRNTIVHSTESYIDGVMFGWLRVTLIMLEELKSNGVTVVKVEKTNREDFPLKIYVAEIVSVSFEHSNQRPFLLVDNEYDRTVRDLERTVENLCRMQTSIFFYNIDKGRWPRHMLYSIIGGDVITTPSLISEPAGAMAAEMHEKFEMDGWTFTYTNPYPRDLFRAEANGAKPPINYYYLNLEPDYIADSRGQTEDEIWILQSAGPDGDLDLSMDLIENFSGTLAKLERELLTPNLYDPTNGISSNGDVFLASQGKFNVPYLGQLYLQLFN